MCAHVQMCVHMYIRLTCVEIHLYGLCVCVRVFVRVCVRVCVMFGS